MATTVPMSDDAYSRDLGGGLTVRWSTAEDTEGIAALYARVFRRAEDAPLNSNLPNWARDMLSGRHPLISPHDFAIVEDTAKGATPVIIAATCLLRYPITYEGISVNFARPEIVATDMEYRNRGLIRAIFELIHAKSAARGDLVQGITGIHHFYRQFGYGYAASMGTALTVAFTDIPPLKPNATEPYTLREATLADAERLLRLWEREQAGAAITTPLSAEYLRWAMAGINPPSDRWRPYLIVEAASERVVGALRLRPKRWGNEVTVDGLAVEESAPLAPILPSVMRGARTLADTIPPIRDETPPAGSVWFYLWNTAHPVITTLGDIAPARTTYPFGAYPEPWYIRVEHIPSFIRHVAPALERRLAASPMAGYSGAISIDFYRGGLRLELKAGTLESVADWRRTGWETANAGFPEFVFLELLFGYRSLHELRDLAPDNWAEGEAAPVLDALFPKRHASLVALD